MARSMGLVQASQQLLADSAEMLATTMADLLATELLIGASISFNAPEAMTRNAVLLTP